MSILEKIKKRFGLFLIMVMVCSMAVIPCSNTEVSAATKKAITLSEKKATLYVGESTTITVKKVKGLSSKKVSYKTNNKKVATVSSKGVVKAKKKGKATITVTSKKDKKVKATFKLTVKAKPKKSSITLKETSATIKQGQTVTIGIKEVKGLSSKKMLYSSSNKAVATVSDKGVVTGKGVGTANITVVSAVNKKVKATFAVTVNTNAVPYAELHGLTFTTQKEFSAPFFSFEGENLKPVENSLAIFKQTDIKLTIDGFAKYKKADGKMNVSVFYTLEGDAEYSGILNKSYYFAYKDLYLYDYYTGLRIPSKSLVNGEDSFDAEKKINWNGKSYDVNYTKMRSSILGAWQDTEYGTRKRGIVISGQFDITMPEEYDGLMLVFDKTGIANYAESNINTELDSTDAYLLNELIKDDILCMRVKDYIN